MTGFSARAKGLKGVHSLQISTQMAAKDAPFGLRSLGFGTIAIFYGRDRSMGVGEGGRIVTDESVQFARNTIGPLEDIRFTGLLGRLRGTRSMRQVENGSDVTRRHGKGKVSREDWTESEC